MFWLEENLILMTNMLKSIQQVRVSSFRNDLLQNPYFSIKIGASTDHYLSKGHFELPLFPPCLLNWQKRPHRLGLRNLFKTFNFWKKIFVFCTYSQAWNSTAVIAISDRIWYQEIKTRCYDLKQLPISMCTNCYL